MKTDYKNLNAIESLAVFFAVTGLFLIGAISFATLPSRTQAQVATAIQIFDMHEQLSAQAEGFKLLAYDLPQDFLGEFYQAFTQVAVIPYETIQGWQELGEDAKVAYGHVLVFSETLAMEYEKNFVKTNPTTLALSITGKVSGESIIVESPETAPEAVLLENIVPPEVTAIEVKEDLRGREYESLEVKNIFKKSLIWMEE